MKSIPLYLVLSFFTIICCNKSSVKEIIHKNGDTTITCFTKNGGINGTCIEYYPSKKIRTLTLTSNGRVEGKCLKYYPNGDLESIKVFKNNKLNGYIYYFHPNKTLDAIVLYLNDHKQGHDYFYDYQNGTIEYAFLGYFSNKYKLMQTYDTKSKKSKINGNMFIDSKNILVDTVKNQTRIITARPFGKFKIEIDLRYAINRDKYTNTELLSITDFGEYIYHGNILNEFDKHKIPLIFATLSLNNGTKLVQNFFIKKEDIKYYSE